MPAATPSPAPAIRVAIRTASVSGSLRPAAEPEGALARPAEDGGGLPAARAVRSAFLGPAGPPLVRAALARPPRVPAATRFSLRRPGRERGRLPITPGSSLTGSVPALLDPTGHGGKIAPWATARRPDPTGVGEHGAWDPRICACFSTQMPICGVYS